MKGIAELIHTGTVSYKTRKEKPPVKVENEMSLRLPALSRNEGVCRALVAAFVAQADPTIEELADIRCAVSEAFTNATVHAYREKNGLVYIAVRLFSDRHVTITVRDSGCGITDVKQARQPLFTTDKSGDRSGMGFSVMESFTDRLTVVSHPGSGTRVTMVKYLA